MAAPVVKELFMDRYGASPGLAQMFNGINLLGAFGNLIYRKTARNFNPMVATCGKVCIAEVEELVPTGQLDPDQVHTPGIFVDRIVQTVSVKRIEQRTVRTSA